MLRKHRFKLFVDYFEKNMPEVETELNYSTPFELLVAVILSAQCTDKRINQVTPALFEAYPTPEAMSYAEVEDIFHFIKSVSYPNNKSKHLAAMSKKMMSEFDGIVPDNIIDLQKLQGVGRKTANVVVSVLFNQPAMAVDTHVFRVSARLGLTKNAKNPLQTEKQLVKYLPENVIAKAHHWLILHGRYTCVARNPKCQKCNISNFCNYFQKKS